MWHGAPLDDFLEPSTTLRVQFLRHLGPIDLNKGHCTTFLGAADFFCVLVHGLSGTRRAQTFFPVHCEPNATPGKTHGRHRGSPGPRTFSHFFNLILEGVYFYRVGAGRRMHGQGIAHQLAPWPCRQATQCAATGQAKPCQVNQHFQAPRGGPEPGAVAVAKAEAGLRPEPMAGA